MSSTQIGNFLAGIIVALIVGALILFWNPKEPIEADAGLGALREMLINMTTNNGAETPCTADDSLCETKESAK